MYNLCITRLHWYGKKSVDIRTFYARGRDVKLLHNSSFTNKLFFFALQIVDTRVTAIKHAEKKNVIGLLALISLINRTDNDNEHEEGKKKDQVDNLLPYKIHIGKKEFFISYLYY